MVPDRFAIILRGLAAGLLLAAILSTAPGHVQAGDAFEVKGIVVDVTAKTAAAAREQALAEGEAMALRKLFQRLTLSSDAPRLPTVSGREVSTYVRDFDVAEEKTSSVRYIATLNYRFNAEAVRTLLRKSSLPFAETFSKPLLVLPVYQDGGRVSLWDEPNPWRQAWSERPASEGLVPTLLPLGDLTDIGTLNANQAIQGDVKRVGIIASRYGAGDTLVAHGVVKNNGAVLEVRLGRQGPTGSVAHEIRTFSAQPGAAAGLVMTQAVTELVRTIEDAWKQDNLLQFGQPGVIPVVIPITNLADWLAIRDRLSTAAVVRQVDMVLMSLKEVRVNLHYLGDPDQLALTLGQADLTLERNEGEEWVLHPASPLPSR